MAYNNRKIKNRDRNIMPTQQQVRVPNVGVGIEPKISPQQMNTNIQKGYNFTPITKSELQIEDKVAHLSLQVNQIIIRPYLQQALDYLRTSKQDAEIAYNQLSDEIAQEVKIIQSSNGEIQERVKDAKIIIEKTQTIIRNKYNNSTEAEISSGQLNLDEEYNLVADQYELAMQLSQELTKYKMRVESLVETQNILDNSIISRTGQLGVEIENLDLLLRNFDTNNFSHKHHLINNNPHKRGNELNKLVDNLAANSYHNVANIRRFDEPIREDINPYYSDRSAQQQVSEIQQKPLNANRNHGNGRDINYNNEYSSNYKNKKPISISKQHINNLNSKNSNIHNLKDSIRPSTEGTMFVVRKSNSITDGEARAIVDVSKSRDSNAIKVIR